MPAQVRAGCAARPDRSKRPGARSGAVVALRAKVRRPRSRRLPWGPAIRLPSPASTFSTTVHIAFCASTCTCSPMPQGCPARECRQSLRARCRRAQRAGLPGDRIVHRRHQRDSRTAQGARPAYRCADPDHPAPAADIHPLSRAPDRRSGPAPCAYRTRWRGDCPRAHLLRARRQPYRPATARRGGAHGTAARLAGHRLPAVGRPDVHGRCRNASARAVPASCSAAWAAMASPAHSARRLRRTDLRAGRTIQHRLGNARRRRARRACQRRSCRLRHCPVHRRLLAGGRMIHSQPATSATRILAGLLEARTGQQIAPSRYWRIQTALGPVAQAHAHPRSRRAGRGAVRSGQREAAAGIARGDAQQRKLLLPRYRDVRDPAIGSLSGAA